MAKTLKPGLTEAEMFPYAGPGSEAECPTCHMIFVLEPSDEWWTNGPGGALAQQQYAYTRCPNPVCPEERVRLMPTKEGAVWAKPTLSREPLRRDRSYREATMPTPERDAEEGDDDDLADDGLPDSDVTLPGDEEREEVPDAIVERARAAAAAQRAAGRGLGNDGTFIPFEERLAAQQAQADAARRRKGIRRPVAPISGKFGDERAFGSTDVAGVSERRQPGVGRPTRDS